MTSLLTIKDLEAGVEDKKILNSINLAVNQGEVHAIMGPNGSGKSSLALAILGHPDYEIKKGSIIFEGRKINKLDTYERAKLGIFLSFQSPIAVEGVSLLSMLKAAQEAKSEKQGNIFELRKKLLGALSPLGLGDEFIMRSVHQGSSGGEKKKIELAQLLTLKPKLAILDEIDTGLDVGALKAVGETIARIKKNTAIILITHYQRILKYVIPDKVHIMHGGKIVKSGDKSLAQQIDLNGYEQF